MTLNKSQIRRLIFYMIIGIFLSVPIHEPYNSMEFYSINVPCALIVLFVLVGGWVVISMEYKA